MALTAIGERPFDNVTDTDPDTGSIEQATVDLLDIWWDQFLPSFIVDTRLDDFETAATFSTQRNDGDNVGGTVSAMQKPEGLPACFVLPADFLDVISIDADPWRASSGTTEFDILQVQYTLNSATVYERLLCCNRGATATLKVRYLYQPAKPDSANDEFGDSLRPATEMALAYSFAEFISPKRSNDGVTIADIRERARAARDTAMALSGQSRSKLFRQLASPIQARNSRYGYLRY